MCYTRVDCVTEKIMGESGGLNEEGEKAHDDDSYN